jgi:hypothetical protein
LGNEKENPKKGGEIFRHRLPSLFCANGYANLGRRFLLSTNANLKEKIMEFIRKINRTEIVTGRRYEMVDFEEEQTHEVFVVELSRQDINTLYGICVGADFRRTNSRRNMDFASKLKEELCST